MENGTVRPSIRGPDSAVKPGCKSPNSPSTKQAGWQLDPNTPLQHRANNWNKLGKAASMTWGPSLWGDTQSPRLLCQSLSSSS